MLSWCFASDGAENGIYMGLIHETLGDNGWGKNVLLLNLKKPP